MVPDAARISASVSDGPEPFLPAISRPGRMARPMTARRGVVGAHRTVAAANALTAPTAPVPLIRRSGGSRGRREAPPTQAGTRGAVISRSAQDVVAARPL